VSRCRLICLLPVTIMTASSQSITIPREFVDIEQVSYNNRAINPQTIAHLHFPQFPDPRTKAFDDEYAQFADRVLIIRNTAVVDDPAFRHDPTNPTAEPGNWTFPSLLAQVLKTVGYTAAAGVNAAQQAAQTWTSSSAQLPASSFNRRWGLSDSQRRLGAIPLLPMAVVNRMDLARPCQTNSYCGAEFRFVYEGITKPDDNDLQNPFFTLILEFVLPPLSADQFVDAVKRWVSLNAATSDDDHRGRLITQLTYFMQLWATGPKQVRIRTNSRGGSAGPWTFGQFALTNQGFRAVPLDQQFTGGIDTKCVNPGSPLAKFIQDPSVQIQALVANYNFPPPTCPTGGGLATCAAQFINSQQTVLTLSKNIVVPAASTVDNLRYALSINSCTGCHGSETQGLGPDTDGTYTTDSSTHFDQLKYRMPNQKSQLSRFLAGGPGGEPLLPPASVYTVSPTPAVAGCGPAAQAQTYNDLLRRFLFHVFVLIKLPPFWVPISTSGLAARQSH
jgi:hypothetical protein